MIAILFEFHAANMIFLLDLILVKYKKSCMHKDASNSQPLYIGKNIIKTLSSMR